VLKPVSGAASLGVRKVEIEADLLSAYAEVIDTCNGLVVCSGALGKKRERVDEKPPDAVLCEPEFTDTLILLEEYLDGPEVDIYLLMADGECQYLAVTDNWPTHEPYFSETWAVLPSRLPGEQVDELKKVAIASVQALGFTDGVFHVAEKYTTRGTRPLEVNARTGGASVRKIHKLAFGVDLVLEQLQLAVGIPCKPIVFDAPQLHLAYHFVNPLKTGSVGSLDFMTAFSKRNGVLWVNTYVTPFEQYTGNEDGQTTWLGEVVVYDKLSARTALEKVKEIGSDIAEAFDARNLNGCGGAPGTRSKRFIV